MRIAKRPLLLIMSRCAVLSLVIAAGVSPGTGQASATDAAPYSATRGTLSAVGTADPAHAPAATTAALPSTSAPAKGARLLHPAGGANTQTRQAGNRPSGSDSSIDQEQPGGLLRSFNGVSSRDSAATNFDQQFEPPDQGLCVGNGFVVEAVNSAYSIYRTDGALVTGPFNVNVLFHEGLREFTSDPRCHFDPATHTWFAIILFISTVDGRGLVFTDHARTDLAVNTSGDPTTPWTVYHIDATDDGTNRTPKHPGCPCLGDQPRLGIDAENIYISTDEFSILGPDFNGAQIYAISKADLVQHASNIRFVHYDNLSAGGTQAFAVQPAITIGNSDAEYFMNSLDPSGTVDNRLAVWALTEADAVRRGGVPTLSNVVITSETYGMPPPAPQKGSPTLLNPDDDRMQQVEFVNGELWGTLGTIISIPGDSAPRAAAAWFDVHPHLNGKLLGGAEVHAQGYVASKGNYLLYPAIAVDRDGAAAIGMTLSGTDLFPSAAYAVLQSGESRFGPIHIAGTGTGPYDASASRWGDYSWAILDPDGNSFWMATEYIPPAASQTTNRGRNWGTRVFQVAASGGGQQGQ